MKAADEQRKREEEEDKRRTAEKRREEKRLEREVRRLSYFMDLLTNSQKTQSSLNRRVLCVF